MKTESNTTVNPIDAAESFLTTLMTGNSKRTSTVVFPPQYMDLIHKCYTQIALTDEEIVKVESNATLRYRFQRNRTKLMRSCRWSMIALYPGLLGCQTRMIIGRPCFDRDYPITDKDLQLAKDRLVKDFVFVGESSSVLRTDSC
jgi:hypothetical protein